MRALGVLSVIFLLGLASAVFAVRGHSTATAGTLTASVGPGFSISLNEGGSAVTNLDPGTYTINVSDMAAVHNFHLSGPGVDQATSIEGTGSATWTVTFTNGAYHFQCDAHPTILKGNFTVGGGGTTSTGTTSTNPTTSTTTTSPTTTTSTTTTTGGTTTGSTTPTAPPTTSTGTTSSTPAETTAATPTSVKLTAHVARVKATRTRVSFTVMVTRPAKLTADLLTRQGKRVAHLTKSLRKTATVALRPAKTLSPGRYVIRLRLTGGGTTLATTRAVRIT
jgi:hypothetical protein